MGKTDKTAELERHIYCNTKKQGVFGCREVTIGWFGKERVDYLTYDTNGVWRCYEIKVSLSDFRSKNNNTFIGHFNYYVVPQELYNKVKEEIPSHVGVYTESDYCVKRAKKQELGVEENILKDSMIRSLSREVDAKYRSGDTYIVNNLEKRIRRVEKEKEQMHSKYYQLKQQLREGAELECQPLPQGFKIR